MDAISCLLQEARPEYIRRKYVRRHRVNCICMVGFSVLLIMPVIINAHNKRTDVESIYSTLYVEQNNQNTYYIDEFDAMGVI